MGSDTLRKRTLFLESLIDQAERGSEEHRAEALVYWDYFLFFHVAPEVAAPIEARLSALVDATLPRWS